MTLRTGRSRTRALVLAGAAAALLFWQLADDDYSNIHPEDYVGPERCRECHEDNHQENFELWHEHSHRVMNQNPDDTTVLGDFSGSEIRYGRGHAVFHRDGPDFLMSIYEGDRLVRRHKVTRTVGSLYVQYYIGTQVLGPEPKGHRTYQMESKLPFGYSVALDRWLPEIYFTSTQPPEHEHLAKNPDEIYRAPPIHNWNATCMNCHNTYPYVARLWKQPGRYGRWWKAGFPREAVDWRGGTDPQRQPEIDNNLVDNAKRGAPRTLPAEDLVTLGISCESCHFGGREHAQEGKEIRFVPTAPQLAIYRPGTDELVESDRKDPLVVNSICAQCHNSELIYFPNSAPSVNSNESIGLMAGACASQIKCTNCHNPHEAGPASGSPDQPGYIEACVSCHGHLEKPAARAQHAHHTEQVTCLDCHMPRIVAGLDTVTRSHFIAVPGQRAMVKAGRANACNLCHLDRSISWTLRELERGWDRSWQKPAKLDVWYGPDRDEPLGTVWLRSPDPFTRLAATEAYARSPFVEDPIPFLLESLKDDYAFNRTVGLIALERLLARPLSADEYDLLALPAARIEQVEKLAESLRLPVEGTESAGRSASVNPGS